MLLYTPLFLIKQFWVSSVHSIGWFTACIRKRPLLCVIHVSWQWTRGGFYLFWLLKCTILNVFRCIWDRFLCCLAVLSKHVHLLTVFICSSFFFFFTALNCWSSWSRCSSCFSLSSSSSSRRLCSSSNWWCSLSLASASSRAFSSSYKITIRLLEVTQITEMRVPAIITSLLCEHFKSQNVSITNLFDPQACSRK